MPNLPNDSKWAFVLVCLVLVLGVTLPGEASGASDDTRHEWVFVDTTVAGYQDLVDDVLAGGDDGRHIELVLLDRRRDGLEQIAEALAGQSGADAIHLITHGSRAELQLGTTRLTADSMLGAHADALSEIGEALVDGGDLLVYGCHFGRGVLGRQAAGRLAALSGADVAASDDLTGAPGLGGDWELEVRTGPIETAVAFSTEIQQDWLGVLPDPWWNAQWRNRASITFDNSASSAPLPDFPVLVTLDTTKLPSLDLGTVVGADVRFIDRTTGTELKYEVEAWDDAADTATVWVAVPQVDATNSDFIWVYYNYNGVATYDQTAVDEQAVRDTGYDGVLHLNETVTDGATGATHDDATGANDGTQQRNARISGQIAGAQHFDGPNEYVDIGPVTNDIDVDRGTFSAWIQLDPMSAQGIILSADDGVTNRIEVKWQNATNLNLHQYRSSGSADNINVAGYDDTSDVWHYATLTWDSTSGHRLSRRYAGRRPAHWHGPDSRAIRHGADRLGQGFRDDRRR
jgi:hypothetical protein